jgi:hypothetical protein
MPFAEINLVPSVNVETTEADNPSGVQESNFIRWKAALPEKRGGCTLYIDQQLDGVPNDIQPWANLNDDKYVAVSTNKYVYAYDEVNANLEEISPRYQDSPKVVPKISTTKGSTEVKITDPNIRSISTYDSVTFNVPVSIGGLFLFNTYKIQSSGGSLFYIDAGYAATETSSDPVVPEFVVTAGSSTILVNFPTRFQSGSLEVNTPIGFSIPTVVGGITIEGQYIISQINYSASSQIPQSFSFVDNQIPTTSAKVKMNNGYLSFRYWKVYGPAQQGSGYGQWSYGQFGYGVGKPLPIVQGDVYSAGNWYLDNRGSNLFASAVGGPIFYWNKALGYQNLAILNNAPIRSNGMFVSMPQGNIMAWGCSDAINPLQDPMYIRWSDSTNPDNWSVDPTIESNAGFYNVPTGSKIVRGIQGPTQQFWFTDIDVYVAQYTANPNQIYQFNKIGNGCGLLAPKAVGVLNNSVYWMSQRQFFVAPSGGAPQPIPCSVWDFIFQNMDPTKTEEVVCGPNSMFNEVNWFFPTKDSNYPNAYVCFNTQYNEWDYGYLNRNAWYDQSIVGEPVAADINGWVYKHETAYSLAVGRETVAIPAYLKTGYFSLQGGQDLSFVDWFLPDMKWKEFAGNTSASLDITFYVTDYAGQEPRIVGPYKFNKDTPFICPRFRGRFVALKIENHQDSILPEKLNTFWRLGSMRYRFAISGRR